MMIPIRCFSCGKVVASSYEPFLERTRAGENPQKVMDDLGLERYCCRRMLVTNVDLINDAAPYA
ncbi:MAG TPA: DNA-directed RNA polymerase subunit N [Candidatus Thermoplasmatota archaeon]|nr:DNA-directed RNA polymerase subunit N [Candidatus Thermoplasmatota archaeon]